jgi:uncharacterized membrane protein
MIIEATHSLACFILFIISNFGLISSLVCFLLSKLDLVSSSNLHLSHLSYMVRRLKTTRSGAYHFPRYLED